MLPPSLNFPLLMFPTSSTVATSSWTSIWLIVAEIFETEPMTFMVEEFAKKINPSEVDVFVGIESRGFIIATALALHYKKPFIMIRKAGKLPGPTLKISYDIEYGSDTMEIEKDAIMQDQRVIICDDLLATGGTAAAAASLVKQSGGKVAALAFVIEIGDLNGGKRLSPHKRISLVVY